MKCKTCKQLLVLIAFMAFLSCHNPPAGSSHIRYPVDTIGFAQYSWQMDSIWGRIQQFEKMNPSGNTSQPPLADGLKWKTVISPHDDYAYAGTVYPKALRNVKASTIILIGVAHRAKLMNLENQLIFDSHDAWMGPYGAVNVSTFREDLIQQLPLSHFQVNDSMHRMEHSLEALIPFLQHQNKSVEIVPILVPYMAFEQMNTTAIPLAESIFNVAQEQNLSWGDDFAVVISNDAVHYGDEGWGGKNFARYGADTAGYIRALEHEQEIAITLSHELTPANIRNFCQYTVQDDNFREYKWTWCGRYSVPFGLLTSFHLNHKMQHTPLQGMLLDYSTSIEPRHIQVDDLWMGVTAPATIRHWVGYAAIGYH